LSRTNNLEYLLANDILPTVTQESPGKLTWVIGKKHDKQRIKMRLPIGKPTGKPIVSQILIGGLFVLLFSLFHLISQLSKESGGIPSVFPLTLVDFSFLLLVGGAYTPLVLAADLFRALFFSDSAIPILPLVLMTALHSLVCATGAEILRRNINQQSLRKGSAMISLFLLVLLIIPLINAGVFLLVSLRYGLVEKPHLIEYVQTIWAVYSGVLVMLVPFFQIVLVPLLKRITWHNIRFPKNFTPYNIRLELQGLTAPGAKRWTAIKLLVLLTAIMAFFMFSQVGPPPYYLLVPPIFWLALSNGLLGTALGNMILCFGSLAIIKLMNIEPGNVHGIPMGLLTVAASNLIFGAMVSGRWRIESENRKQELLYRRLSETAFDGVMLSEGPKIVDFNKHAEDLLEYTRSELKELTLHELFKQDPKKVFQPHPSPRELQEATVYRIAVYARRAAHERKAWVEQTRLIISYG
jgi:PAS domain-containing protein